MDKSVISKNPERTIVDLASLGFQHLYLIGKYAYPGARMQLETHSHPEMIEICYCEKGQQIYEVEQKEYRLKGGDVFITFPDEPHSTAEYPEDKGVLYWLQIKLPKNKETFLGYNSAYAQTLIGSVLNVPCRHFKGTVYMKNMLEEVISLAQHVDFNLNTLLIYNLVTNFLLAVVKCGQTAAVTTYNKTTRLENITKFIEENLFADLSITMLAAHQHISESHFKSWFRKEMGITPIDYILRERIDKAKKILLKNRSLSITQIALELNFSSSQYFATVLKSIPE